MSYDLSCQICYFFREIKYDKRSSRHFLNQFEQYNQWSSKNNIIQVEQLHTSASYVFKITGYLLIIYINNNYFMSL